MRFIKLAGCLAACSLLWAGCGDEDEALEASDRAGGSGFQNGNGGFAPPSVPTPSPGGVANDPDAQGPSTGGPRPVVNPFVRVEHDPFSTFAADVDSASYDVFVKSLSEQDALIDPQMARSEEFVNFFVYAYPPVAQASPHPFAIHLDLGPTPGASTMLLRVGIQGRDLLENREGANLVFLIDVSGSMGARDKLPLVKRMLFEALDVLRPDDTVAIVTYSGQVRRALAPTPIAQAETIRPAINELIAGGSTAGGDGLQLAYDQAEAAFIEGGINHIILCTDGDFNVGPYTNQQLVALVEQRRGGGVTFTALGFGLGNLNDSMMEAISNAGNGIYRVISGEKTARRYVEYRLVSDVMHIAKDVKIQVELNPSYVYAYRQIGYENRQLQDEEFRDDRIDAGEIGSGHQMTALYELALDRGAMPDVAGAPPVDDGDPVEGTREIGANDIALVKLRYKAPGASESDPATEMKVSLPSTARPAGLDAETRFAFAAATLAARLREDPYQSGARVEAARRLLDEQATAPNAERVELRSLFDRALGLLGL